MQTASDSLQPVLLIVIKNKIKNSEFIIKKAENTTAFRHQHTYKFEFFLK